MNPGQLQPPIVGRPPYSVAPYRDVFCRPVRSQRPTQLVKYQDHNRNGIQHQKNHLVQQRMREEAQSQALHSLRRRTITPRTGILPTRVDFVLLFEQVEGVAKIHLLPGRDNGQQVFDKEAQKRMPVAYTLVVQADLYQEHGQYAVLTDVKCHGSIDNDFAPEGALLRVDDNGEDGGDLDGEDEPALRFLEFDERGGEGDACARQRRRVAPDDGLDACQTAGEAATRRGSLQSLFCFLLFVAVAHVESECFEEQIEGSGKGHLENI